jgi:hypothetical protein
LIKLFLKKFALEPVPFGHTGTFFRERFFRKERLSGTPAYGIRTSIWFIKIFKENYLFMSSRLLFLSRILFLFVDHLNFVIFLFHALELRFI